MIVDLCYVKTYKRSARKVGKLSIYTFIINSLLYLVLKMPTKIAGFITLAKQSFNGIFKFIYSTAEQENIKLIVLFARFRNAS